MTEPIAITPQSLGNRPSCRFLTAGNSSQLTWAYDLLGWPATELIGHRLAELVHRTDLPKLSDYLEDPLTKGHSVVFDSRIEAKDGALPLTHLEEASAFELSRHCH